MNKKILIAALNDYLLHIQIDSLGDVTPQVNATKTLTDYAENHNITEEWVKSNWAIIVPAVKCYRKTLKGNIDHARLTGREDKLSILLAEYNDLQPYITLAKTFEKFLSW